MILTKKKAIELSIELWTWLAETGEEKDNWPEWEKNGGQHIAVEDDCFLCKYVTPTNRHCDACPYSIKYGCCQDDDSPYLDWEGADGVEDMKKYAAQFLEQLKTLQEGK